MAEAHAHNRQPAGKMAHGGDGNACFFGRTGTWPDNEILRFQGFNFFKRDIVVTLDDDLLTEFGKILDDVVGKTVVIIDKQKHNSDILLIYNIIFLNYYS